VEIANNNGRTPLYYAASNIHMEAVRELLKHGAKVESGDKNGRSPLYIAASNVDVEVVRELLKQGANVEDADEFFSNSWLQGTFRLLRGCCPRAVNIWR